MSTYIKKKLLVLFYLLLIIIMSFIIGISFYNILYQTKNYNICFIVAIMLIGVIFLYHLINSIFKKKSIKYKRIVIAFIIFIFITFLLIFSYKICDDSKVLIDYKVIYNTAISISNHSILEYHDYYYLYYNNIFITYFLSFIIMVANTFAIKDVHSVMVFVGVFISFITILFSSYYIYIETKKHEDSLLLLLLFILFVPLWIISRTVYTDHISLFCSVSSFSLLYLSFYEKRKSKKVFFIIMSAFIISFGINIKITVIISFIALFIALILKNKIFHKNIVLYIIFVLIFNFNISNYVSNTKLGMLSKNTSDPIVSWIALGIKGDGSIFSGFEFLTEVHSFKTKKDKYNYSVKYIKENINSFYDIKHIRDKINYNYSNGYFGINDYINYNKKNIVYNFFSKNGKYYMYGLMYTYSYILVIYIIYFISFFIVISDIIKNKEISYTMLMIDICFVGYFLFLLVFEANNRLLYNFIPLLLIGCVIKLRKIYNLIIE